MIPSLPLSPYSLFSLIFPSGAALILSYIHPTPLHHHRHYLSSSFSSSMSLSLSLWDMWYLLASAAYFLYLSVPSALTTSPLPLSILISSTPCISSQHLWTYPSSPLPIFISPLSGSPSPSLHACLSVCICSLPVSAGSALIREGAEGGMNLKW